MTSSPPRVVIADGQPLVAEAFERLLASECVVVGRASDGPALLDAIRAERPDIVVADSALPLVRGLDLVRRARELQPALKVVIVTADEDPAQGVLALEHGAWGYLLRRCAGAELLRAIAEVAANRIYVTPLVAGAIVRSSARRDAHEARPHLTVRQREVLQLLAQGKSMKEAASVLHIGARTVAFHKYRLMERLNVKSNAELIRFALEQHVI